MCAAASASAFSGNAFGSCTSNHNPRITPIRPRRNGDPSPHAITARRRPGALEGRQRTMRERFMHPPANTVAQRRNSAATGPGGAAFEPQARRTCFSFNRRYAAGDSTSSKWSMCRGSAGQSWSPMVAYACGPKRGAWRRALGRRECVHFASGSRQRCERIIAPAAACTVDWWQSEAAEKP